MLPFQNRTRSDGLGDRVRESFFGRLSLKRFADIELRDLDSRLNALPEAWTKMSPQQLGQALRCEALVYGEVIDASNVYLGVYAQLTLEGKIQFVDAHTGQTLVIGSHATKFRAGGVPFSLLEVVPNAVLNLRNFSSEQAWRAVDDLARHLADQIPDLPDTDPLPSTEEPKQIAVQATVEETEPKKVAAPLLWPTEPGVYRVQVAAFSKPGEAQHVARLLRNEGFQPTVVTATQEDRAWHKVMLGPFPSFQAAQETGERVQKRLSFTPMVVRSSSY
ncbi:MAG TPA: SPOR domain-containing protein [Methylomirabilota bacterium]|nr:SPOR domain-containing protein [Methylomirabilota bacterium]